MYGQFVEEATVDLSTIQEEEIQEAGLDLFLDNIVHNS